MSGASDFTAGRETDTHQRPRGYFTEYRPQRKTRILLDQVKEVLVEYQDYLPLTVRQIFYRLVGAYGYEKTEAAYDRLGDKLTLARRAKMIPFEHIRDDGVTIASRRWFEDSVDFWDDTGRRIRDYERDKQVDQEHYIELWCEAQGMMPQLARVAELYSIPVYSCSGFSSLSAVREIVNRAERRSVPTVFLHVGDYDPSGMSIFTSMTEDAAAFLSADRILATSRFIPVRVALTAALIKTHDLPTSEPKKSDSRSEGWTGGTCQLEALAPDVLADIVQAAIEQWMDMELYDEHVGLERAERIQMLRALPSGDPS